MGSSFKVITPVTTEPISLNDAKAYLRVDFSDDDIAITEIIQRARSYAEKITNRALATQVIQHIDTITRPEGGVLSGPMKEGPNWYIYQEQLGANPFGPAQYYHDLSMPPIQASQNFTVETKVTAFDPWSTFQLVTNNDGSQNYWIDDNAEPARVYFQSPITANFWRFTYTAGYNSSYSVPPGLLQPIYEAIAYWYQFREAQDLPSKLVDKLLAYRVDWI